ncbi:MAG: PD-(D/E)XK nuclease domain-containing protein [bacterium]
MTRGGQELRQELESLVRNESVEKPIEENIVFAELEHRDDLLWSFLLFGGYLKYVKRRVDERDPTITLAQLTVPNLEVRGIFTRLIRNWFNSRFEQQKLQMMLQALVNGNVKDFGRYLRDLVINIFSYHDFGAESEKVYQAFTIGLLVWLGEQYEIKSNRESGYGRYDLMIIPHEAERVGYVIEFKKVDTYENETEEIAIRKAFEQIEEKKYAAELAARGIKTIKILAIVFEGKQVWVREKMNA